MSLPLAVKIGSAGTVVAGVPTTYFVWDKYFSLNEIENAVLEDGVVLGTAVENNGVKVTATTNIKVPNSTEESKVYKWECTVTEIGNGTDISKLKSYLDSELPISNDLNSDPKKDKKFKNKHYLVRACSKNRKDTVDDVFKADLEITVNKKENGEIIWTSLFGSKENQE